MTVTMRDRMPATAAFVDELRQAFGAKAIDVAIRRGLRGEQRQFHAIENGHEIGTAWPADDKSVPVSESASSDTNGS